jgi:hypothetical protein
VVQIPPVPHEDWVVEAQLVAQPGQLLDPPADWGDAVVVVTVRGETQAQIRERLDLLIDRMGSQFVVESP